MFLLNFSYGYVWLWYNQTRKLFLLSTAVQVFLLFLCFFPCFSPSFYIFFPWLDCRWNLRKCRWNADKWRIWGRGVRHPPHNVSTYIGSEKSLVKLSILKNELFHFFTFFALLKVYFSLWAMSGVKLSSADYNGSNKPNPKSLAHIESEKSLVKVGVPKNELFTFFTFFTLLSHSFLKCITYKYALF